MPMNWLPSASSPQYSQLHADLIERFEVSRAEIASNHDRWERLEELFDGYRPASEADAVRDAARRNGQPAYRTLVVPFGYASVVAASTYLSTVFLARNPIFQYTGVNVKGVSKADAINALIAYHVTKGQMIPHLIQWLRNHFIYGFSVVRLNWDVRQYVTTRTVSSIPLPYAEPVEEEVTETHLKYEGNSLTYISPFDYYPDPGCLVGDVQNSEFIHVITRMSRMQILRAASTDEWQNVDRIDYNNAQLNTRRSFDTITSTGTRPVIEIKETYWELIPSEYGLSSEVRPQKWYFVWSDEGVHFAAPFPSYSDRFPFFVNEFEPGLDKSIGLGLLHRTESLEEVANWLLNSRLFNVRSTLNSTFIADPSRVNIEDLRSSEPGKIIRLRPGAYGSRIDDIIRQLPIADVTSSHVNDVRLVLELLERISGVSANMMGTVSLGGRKTATEVESSNVKAGARLQTHAQAVFSSAWEPLGSHMLMNAQQYMSAPRLVRIAGDDIGTNLINVSPEDIMGQYDVTQVDATMPLNPIAMSSVIREMLMLGMSSPLLADKYDWARLFGSAAKRAGILDVEAAKLNMQSPESIDNQLRMGNIVKRSEAPSAPVAGNEPGMDAIYGALR